MTKTELDILAEMLGPIIRDYVREISADFATRVTVIEAKAAALPHETVALLRERVAVLETRAPVPGPSGPAGRDGLGFGDLVGEYDGERTYTIKAVCDGQVKDVGRFTVPAMIYRDVWKVREAAYTPGDVVTHDGSGWVCTKDTITQPGTAAGAGFWKLFVKRGGK